MKMLSVLLVTLFVIGCSTPRKTIEVKGDCTVSDKGLFDTTGSKYIPSLKTCYEHGDNSLLKVLQVVDGGVLVSPGYSFADVGLVRSGCTVPHRSNIFIKTEEEYVDGQSLRPGYYEYIGTYTYTTVQNARATVRMYRKLRVGNKNVTRD
jgi:hypothetical protein